MYRRRGTTTSSRIDWLPWSLSVFGACCAVFVLVRGVLPERAVNRELLQRVARLETDLTRTRQAAADDVARAREQLAQQTVAAQAELGTIREQERRRATREAARRDLAVSIGAELEAGAAVVEDRGANLAIVVEERFLFPAGSSVIEPRGRKFLRALASTLRRLPAQYQIAARTDRQERAIIRFLDIAGRVPAAQLTPLGAGAGAAANPGSPPVQIVVVMRDG